MFDIHLFIFNEIINFKMQDKNKLTKDNMGREVETGQTQQGQLPCNRISGGAQSMVTGIVEPH